MSRRPEHSDLSDFGDVLQPSEAVEPILARPVRSALLDWLTEIWAKDELEAVNVKPRRRAIFDGPPGVGKTTLAHHLAARLGIPLLCIRSDEIIESWMGSSERNLAAAFRCAAKSNANGEPIVLFFDEFDTLAQKRNHEPSRGGATEARNAIVNVLLQRIDAHDGFIIAATNHGREIDPAVWRRFHIHIALALPGSEERIRIFERYLAPFKLRAAQLAMLAEATETATPALIREFCEGLKRQIIIGPKAGWDMRKSAAIDRLIATIAPHPECGKPRLWSHGSRDAAVAALTWPLTTDEPPIPEFTETRKVINLRSG